MTTKTGPQAYPGANRTHWYQGTFRGDAMEVNVVVLHTTEGRTLPDYGGGAVAPTLTAVPDFAAKRLRWYQHFDIDTSARALVNLPGGVETNTNNVCQVELVGTCDPGTRDKWVKAGYKQDIDFIFWPEAPDWALREVAEFLKWLNANHSVPLTGPTKWPVYPTSYANGGHQRMSFEQWNDFKGICGHMHVPENVHGDPGAIDFPKLIALATEKSPAPQYEPFPGTEWFKKKPSSKIITAMGKRLVEVGYRGYKVGPGSQWTEADRSAYAWWQRKLGYTGSDADGWPGKKSWDALKVPNV